jgi:hypothetical protein
MAIQEESCRNFKTGITAGKYAGSICFRCGGQTGLRARVAGIPNISTITQGIFTNANNAGTRRQ